MPYIISHTIYFTTVRLDLLIIFTYFAQLITPLWSGEVGVIYTIYICIYIYKISCPLYPFIMDGSSGFPILEKCCNELGSLDISLRS